MAEWLRERTLTRIFENNKSYIKIISNSYINIIHKNVSRILVLGPVGRLVRVTQSKVLLPKGQQF